MPEVKCGFSDADGASGADWLVHYGPTLQVDIGVDPNYDPDSDTPPASAIVQVHALVDTGATESAIDQSLARQLGLPAVEQGKLAGIGGSYLADMYLAQINIPILHCAIYGKFAGVDLLGGGQKHQALIGRTFLRACRMTYEGVTGNVVISRQ